MSLAELGRAVADMDDRQLVAYLEGLEPEDLDALEEAVAAAEAEAGMSAEAAQLAREHESAAARYARWWSDPAAFAAEAFTWPEGRQLHGYQAEALTTLASRLRLVLRKLRGAGGSAIAAMTVLWFAVTSDFYGVDWKCITTASVQRQLDDYLWPEIHKWAKRLRWEQLGRAPWILHRELLDQGIKLAHGEAFAASPGDAATIEGLHATRVLILMDEAKGIRKAVFDAIEGGSTRYGPETGATLYAIALSTAGPTEGRFYDLCRGIEGTENWARQHITQQEAVAAGQVSATELERLGRLWGTDSVLYANHCLGEFKDDSADTVIPLPWVEAAHDRWRALTAIQRAAAATEAGVDVARGGRDRSVLIALAADVVGKPIELPRGDGPTTAAGAYGHVGLGPHGPVVLVDSEGVGASVYDAMRRRTNLGPRVLAFRAGTGTDFRDASGVLTFANLRSAAWWHLRELLDPALSATLAIPPHDKLTGDLTTPKWRDTSRGIVIESKDDIRKRLGRSTDHGDALVMGAWGRILRRRANLRPSVSRSPDPEAGSIMGDILNEGL